jgi:hypothetical protein
MITYGAHDIEKDYIIGFEVEGIYDCFDRSMDG